MIELLLTYKYFIIFPLAIVEGPFVMMICGLLVKLGYLNFTLAFILLMTGDLLGDIIWYGIGYKFGMTFVKKFGKFFGIGEENIQKVKSIFHKYHAAILFLSKITMGLGFALVTLVTAGLSKIPFRRFVFWNALGGIVWTAALMLVGFYLGNFYLKVNGVLGIFSTLALFVVVFIVLISIARYVRKRIVAKNSL
jgi:membrane protein DedA with SNARE-associated domain